MNRQPKPEDAQAEWSYPFNVWPAPQKVFRHPVESISIAGGLTATSALRALADWLEANDLQPSGPITISHSTLATYACTTVTTSAS